MDKKSNTDDIVYCDFNSIVFTLLRMVENIKILIWIYKFRQKIFENILDELGLINTLYINFQEQ